jgi:hypothetical protein
MFPISAIDDYSLPPVPEGPHQIVPCFQKEEDCQGGEGRFGERHDHPKEHAVLGRTVDPGGVEQLLGDVSMTTVA